MADITASVVSWSTTESSNQPTDSTTIGAGLDDNLRAIQAGTAREFAKGSDLPSASSVDIGAAGTSGFVDITGTTTITSFATARAGTRRWVRFTGTAIITHNATSLILPGAVNIKTQAGDVALFISLGSGNWVCAEYLSSKVTHIDNAAQAINYADPTKLWAVDLSAINTGTTITQKISPRNSTLATRELYEAYAVGSGTNTYTAVSQAVVIAAYLSGGVYFVKFPNPNTNTAPTIDIDSVGAVTITRQNGVALKAGDIGTNHYAALQYDGTNMVLLNPQSPRTFVSADSPISSAGTLTLAHGLGGTPIKMWYGLVNVSAEYGWNGEVLHQAFAPQDASATVARGATAYADATNVYVQYGSGAAVFNVHQKTGTPGLTSAATNTNWRLRVYAEL
jgi:hypothetical protein